MDDWKDPASLKREGESDPVDPTHPSVFSGPRWGLPDTPLTMPPLADLPHASLFDLGTLTPPQAPARKARKRSGAGLIFQGAGATSAPAESEGAEAPAEERTWVDVRVLHDEDAPAGGLPYVLTLSGGKTKRGRLNEYGEVSLRHIKPGPVTIAFPDLLAHFWAPAEEAP